MEFSTLAARGFSCAVSGIGHVCIGDPREKKRHAASLVPAAEAAEPKRSISSAAREKKPLVPRVGIFQLLEGSHLDNFFAENC